ncbi:unnamed protein product [Chironomus riparius]|uniref:Uncharacterized protein n=1 Tax=Chironomus riparius TaxID=315576 RepID=A0A9N9WXZ2_9DIPT|nr:unnamed protein product [Chironomus riparius]
MDQPIPDLPQSKPKTPRMKLNFDNLSDENINEIKPHDNEDTKIDEDEAEESQEMSENKKAGCFAGLFSWCGKKREIVRAKTMKYGARLTKNGREEPADKSTISLAAAMAMCKKDERIKVNENM